MAPPYPQLAFQFHDASFWPRDFDLDSALSPGTYPFDLADTANPFPIDISTCTSDDNVHYDCFSNCNEHAFESFQKLATCSNVFLLSNTTYTEHEFRYSVQDSRKVPILGSDNKPTDHYVITPEVNSLGNSTRQFIQNCLKQQYTDITGNKSPPQGGDASYLGLEGAFNPDVLYALCLAIPGQLDPDLAGIGVYISYWVHACLVLFLFIASLLVKGCAVYLFDWHHGAEWKSKLYPFAENRLASLKAGLVELHKSQCFFTIALNIAAIKIFKRGGLDPQTLEQIYDNWLFVQNIAISGYLPITFTLLNLNLLHKISWYLVFLSCVSIALSIGTIGVLGGNFRPTPKDLAKLQDVFNKPGPAECQFKQPSAYCYVDTYAASLTDSDQFPITWEILIFCLIVFAILILDEFRKNPLRLPPFAKSMWQKTESMRKMIGKRVSFLRIGTLCRSAWHTATSCIPTRLRGRRNLSRSVPFLAAILRLGRWTHDLAARTISSRRVQKASKIVMYCAIIALYGYFFGIYLTNLRVFATRQAYSDRWSFGQVVALLVWVPPICEYVNTEIEGPEKAPEHRFIENYYVAKRDTSDTHPGQIDGIVEGGRHTEGEESLKQVSTEVLVEGHSTGAHAEENDIEMMASKRLPDNLRLHANLDSDFEYFGGRYDRLPQDQHQ